MRPGVGRGGLHDLHKHAARGARVHKGNARVADPDARLGIDQLQPRTPHLLKGPVDVCNLVGDVVQSGPALGQELTHGCVVTKRRKQLDVILADVEQSSFDALLGHHLAVSQRKPKAVSPELDRGVQLGNRDPYVVDSVEHQRPVYMRRGAALAERAHGKIAEELCRERQIADIDALVSAVHERRGRK